jgi:CHAT domain-containing protein
LLYDQAASPAHLAARLASAFPAGTGIVFYEYEAGRLHTFVFGAGGLLASAEAEVLEEDLAGLVAAYRALLIASDGTARGLEIVAALGARKEELSGAKERLTALLLPGAVASAVGGLRHLVVVPVFGLGTVPFAALEVAGRPLVETTSVSIAPSIFDVWRDVPPWEPRIVRPLVVGNPAFSVAGVPPLPGAEREATNVARRLRTQPLLGAAATRAAVLDRASSADLLYFATHGIASPEDPMGASYLLLAGGKESWLTPREIQEMRLPANLVVLSACQTGLGGVHRGGVSGLARAFQIAGAPRVVMSHWNVDDEDTAKLMDSFVTELEHTFPSEALRRAMVALRRERPAAARWAPFTVFGTPR